MAIRFWNVAPNRIRIEIVVHNRGVARSQATPMAQQESPRWQSLPYISA
jgi:hypothetical protein